MINTEVSVQETAEMGVGGVLQAEWCRQQAAAGGIGWGRFGTSGHMICSTKLAVPVCGAGRWTMLFEIAPCLI